MPVYTIYGYTDIGLSGISTHSTQNASNHRDGILFWWESPHNLHWQFQGIWFPKMDMITFLDRDRLHFLMMLIGWFPNCFDWDIAAAHFLAAEQILALIEDTFRFTEQLFSTIGGASAQTHIDLGPRMSFNPTSAEDGESLEPWSKLAKWLRKHPCSCWVAISSSCACMSSYVYEYMYIYIY